MWWNHIKRPLASKRHNGAEDKLMRLPHLCRSNGHVLESLAISKPFRRKAPWWYGRRAPASSTPLRRIVEKQRHDEPRSDGLRDAMQKKRRVTTKRKATDESNTMKRNQPSEKKRKWRTHVLKHLFRTKRWFHNKNARKAWKTRPFTISLWKTRRKTHGRPSNSP